MSITVLVTIVWVSVIVMMLGFLFEGLDMKYGPILITIGAVGMASMTILLIIELICMLFGVSILLL